MTLLEKLLSHRCRRRQTPHPQLLHSKTHCLLPCIQVLLWVHFRVAWLCVQLLWTAPPAWLFHLPVWVSPWCKLIWYSICVSSFFPWRWLVMGQGMFVLVLVCSGMGCPGADYCWPHQLWLTLAGWRKIGACISVAVAYMAVCTGC